MLTVGNPIVYPLNQHIINQPTLSTRVGGGCRRLTSRGISCSIALATDEARRLPMERSETFRRRAYRLSPISDRSATWITLDKASLVCARIGKATDARTE